MTTRRGPFRFVCVAFAGAVATSACRPVRLTPTAARAPAGDGRHADPDAVRLVTRDIPNFWRAVDQAAGRDSAERVRVFEEVYLRPGTPGLRDWARVRLMSGNVVRLRYYERAADKRAAVRELLVMPDPERVLRESGYAAYAEALP